MSDGFVVVDTALETPPYQQIVDQLRALIERGDLAPATVLPTVRQLAGDLGVAPNTVARAYAELQEDGWIVSDGRRGTHVASRVPSADKRVRGRALREAVAKLVTSLRHRGYSAHEIGEELRRTLGSLTA
ncbi:MAG TPA: GntR family transcriptional regulator [Candidatus Elarobacter sp.]|nr:GntR family transcriptional regulator [Candidatus Elarobacter sp.]